jgi:hypothetical protein
MSRCRIKILFVCVVAFNAISSFAEVKTLFKNNFQEEAPGKVPESFLVLDGAFAVKADGQDKFLELPGAPLDTFGVLFGPTEKSDLAVTARIHGTAKGRRFPTFAVGLNGVGGYKLQVAPAKKTIELFKGEELKASVPYEWKSDTWTLLRLQLRKAGDVWKVTGKAWPQGHDEPKQWQLTFDETTEPVSGRPSVWGNPYAGTPIRYDDLVVTSVAE